MGKLSYSGRGSTHYEIMEYEKIKADFYQRIRDNAASGKCFAASALLLN
jgi:hypothetical protein